MRPPRTVARLGACLCLLVTSSLWARIALQSSAAPADFLDVPGSLAASADGDVYVSFATDYGAAVVRRFSADGVVLARWEVAGGANGHPGVAEAYDGGVYVAVSELDVVRHYSPDGELAGEWPVDGLASAIASATRSDAGRPGDEVVVLASSYRPDHSREVQVRQFDQLGGARGVFPVAVSSFDLALWPAAAGGEPEVWVTEDSRALDGSPFVSRYDGGGDKLGEFVGGGWGMDVDAATNRIWMGEIASFRLFLRAQAYERDGTPSRRCDLTTSPVDLTIGPDGDLYILAEDPSARNVHAIHRYRQDCRLVDTWDLEQLNGLEQPTPTGPTPTATNAPSATDTATAVSATATETPTPDMLPGTLRPTATYTPFDDTPYRWRLYLPVAMRGGA